MVVSPLSLRGPIRISRTYCAWVWGNRSTSGAVRVLKVKKKKMTKMKGV